MQSPNYSKYSLKDLYECRDQINKEKYPENYSKILDAISEKEKSGEQLPDNPRPTGITILSILYFVGGIGLFVIPFIFRGSSLEGFETIGVSEIGAYLSIGFLALLGIFAGIGMWIGKKWGWWLGAFYILYSIARNTNALIMIPLVVEQFGAQDIEVTRFYIKHGGRVIFHSLLLLYFFKSNVVDYFSVGEIGPWKRFGILLGILTGVFVFFALVSALTLPAG